MPYVYQIRNERIRNALEELNAAYEQERKGRAKDAWQHGVMWVVFKLQDGVPLEVVIEEATKLGVDFK